MGDWRNLAARKQGLIWSLSSQFLLTMSNNAVQTRPHHCRFVLAFIPRLSLLLSHSLSPMHSHLEPTSTVTRSCVSNSLCVGDPTVRCSLIAIAIVAIGILLSRGCPGHVCSRMDFHRNSERISSKQSSLARERFGENGCAPNEENYSWLVAVYCLTQIRGMETSARDFNQAICLVQAAELNWNVSDEWWWWHGWHDHDWMSFFF